MYRHLSIEVILYLEVPALILIMQVLLASMSVYNKSQGNVCLTLLSLSFLFLQGGGGYGELFRSPYVDLSEFSLSRCPRGTIVFHL